MTQQIKPIESLKYNIQFDGLRCCAVFLVVCYHWLPTVHNIKAVYHLGGAINFFFVLSSYLITRILFSGKYKGITQNISRFKVYFVFIVRRTIRIFPPYYLYLIAVMLIPVLGAEIRDNAGSYFFYIANYHMFFNQVFHDATAHTWTLSVEEQFYILWPLVIFFVPQKFILRTFVAIVLITVVARIVFYQTMPVIPQAILTQYCLDAFAIGGILAYKQITCEKEKQLIEKYFRYLFYIALAGCPLIILIGSDFLSFTFNRLFFSVISMRLIEMAISGYKGLAGRFLSNPSVRYIGRISYGIYLYHLAIPFLFWRGFDFLFWASSTRFPDFFKKHENAIIIFQKILIFEPVSFVIYSALTLAVASLSFKYFETPINKLKLPYKWTKK